MTGAVAAATSRIKVGTWILSALHRNPGITAKAVETMDEISGGRFVFGLGSGHAGRQAHAFGLPEDHVYGQFEEAVQIIVPLLRQGRADFEGTFHAARDLEQRPLGPRPGRIPIMIGAKGPKMLRLAALHADIWSWYVEERSDLDEFGPRLEPAVDTVLGQPEGMRLATSMPGAEAEDEAAPLISSRVLDGLRGKPGIPMERGQDPGADLHPRSRCRHRASHRDALPPAADIAIGGTPEQLVGDPDRIEADRLGPGRELGDLDPARGRAVGPRLPPSGGRGRSRAIASNLRRATRARV